MVAESAWWSVTTPFAIALALGSALAAVAICCGLRAAWERRWQLVHDFCGVDPYRLLPSSFDAQKVGIMRVEPDVYEGGSSSDDEDGGHSHSHGHDHGARDVPIVGQRWVVVVGASRASGHAFVRKLSDLGFSILCLDNEGQPLGEVVAQAQRRLERGWRGGVWPRTAEMPRCVAIGCDLDAVDDVVSRCTSALAHVPAGSLKLLVCTDMDRLLPPDPLSHSATVRVDASVGTSLLLVTQLTHSLWPRLVDGSRGGRAGVLVVSSAKPVPSALAAAYATTRAATRELVRSLRAEAAVQRVALDVLAVAPRGSLAGRLPRWLGDRAVAEPDGVASTSILLLPTVSHEVVAPLLSNALVDSCASGIAALVNTVGID